MKGKSIRKKQEVRRGIAFVLSLIMIIGLWQTEGKAAGSEFGETVVSLFGTTFAIQQDGSLWAWGQNGSGQLGDGTQQDSIHPRKIMDGVITAVLGEGNAYALKEDGSLWAWGSNYSGLLGTGSTGNILTPQRVLEEVRELIPGESSNYAIKEDGSLWSWGSNDYGQLGDGTTAPGYAPVKVMEDVVRVIAIDRSIYAIDTSGGLWVWGNDSQNQLGLGTALDRNPVPRKILDDIKEVQANGSVAYALAEDDSLWSWGNDSVPGIPLTSSPTPQRVMSDVREFAIDRGGAYAIKNDGNLWTWKHPQSIIGTTAMMSGENQWLTDVDEIIPVGNGTAYAKKNDGSLWSWGMNGSGQIGNGSFEAQTSPVKVLDDVWRVMANSSTVYVIRNDDSLWAWGENADFGQVGIGTTANQNSPQKVMDGVKKIVSFDGTAFALQADNSLWGWGNNGLGQLGIGSSIHQRTPQKVMEKVAMMGDTITTEEPITVTPKPLSTALEVIVRRELGKLTGDLTDSDWLRLTGLDLSGVYLESLGGLEKARNLKELDLSFAQVDDIMTIALLPNLRTVNVRNSKVPADQLALLKKRLSNVNFLSGNLAVTDTQVKLWNTNQEGDALVSAAEEIIENAGKQQLGSSNGVFTINQTIAKNGAKKAGDVKGQIYAKAILEGKELNKEPETIVKISLTDSGQQISRVRINQNVSELDEIDKLVIEVRPDVDLLLTSEELKDGMRSADMEIEVEEVKDTALYLKNPYYASGGNGKKSKTYRVKMKKGKSTAKVGLALKTDDDPYNAVFRKGEKGEELIGGKYNAKTKKLAVKIGDDGEYYVRKNEKNFGDIEGLPSKQKEMIKILASKGILQGNNGQFMPNAGITRSEILTILVRLSYVYDSKASSSFRDVGTASWYYPYISSGVKIGVVNGYPDNTFKPLGQIGSAELTKMNTMMLVYKKGYRFPKQLQKYLAKLATGSNIPNWAKIYVAMGEREGLLIKNINGLFDGTQQITRAQAAEMLYRLYEKL